MVELIKLHRHSHSRIRRALCHVLSLILSGRIARRICPCIPSISIDGPSGVVARHIDTPNVLPVQHVGTPLIPMDGPSESRATHQLDTSKALPVHRVSSCDKCTSYVPCLQLLLTACAGRVTISILPDDVLLQIFHFDRLGDIDPNWCLSWHRLVHVCQRWRYVVFRSPTFLDLKLVSGPMTRVKLMGIWPPLPIIIRNKVDWPMPEDYDFDAAIVDPNRVCEIGLYLTSLQLQLLTIAMQERFPALIHLKLAFIDYDGSIDLPPALPDKFLDGSSPRLQTLELDAIPFPALPKLLLSATDLVHLTLRRIPHSGYLAPETIVTGLAVMANLKSLAIEFEPFVFLPDRESRRSPSSTRTILPALTRLAFQGVSEYLEDLVSQIDAPILDTAYITFHQLIFDIPQVAEFMMRTTRFEVLNEAHLDFDYLGVQFGNIPPTWDIPVDEMSGFRITVMRVELDQWNLSLSQFLTSIFPFIYMVKHIYIYGPLQLSMQWRIDVDNIQWLEILHPLTALKSLYLSRAYARLIAPVLQNLVGDRATEVLPTLQNLYLEGLRPWGPIQEGIERFVAARQLSGNPITVSLWKRDPDPFEDLEW